MLRTQKTAPLTHEQFVAHHQIGDPPYSFSNVTVFISNSETDGYREGDGDLMDKLARNLPYTCKDITAIRVVSDHRNIPHDKQGLVGSGIAVLAKSEAEIGDQMILRNNFLEFVRKYRGTNRIVYIGSRIDMHPPLPGCITGRLGESGSLFDAKLIHDLKAEGVKIVVCCLEYMFFRRSPRQLRRAVEMVKQQLFWADKIEFLTFEDLNDFCFTMEWLKANRSLPLLRIQESSGHTSFTQEERESEAGFSFSFYNIKRCSEWLDSQKHKATFISGIYTVDPLTKEMLNLSTEEEFLQVLQHRPPNILCFGLVRGDKGVDPAVALARKFAEQGMPNKVYIVGKVKTLSIIVKNLQVLFELWPKQVRTDLLPHMGKYFIPEDWKKMSRDQHENIEGLTRHFHKFLGYESLNHAATFMYQWCLRNCCPKINPKNIELCLYLSEDEVRRLSLQCRYAVKLDHKGMANNASAMVSALGCFLPVITTCGLVTDSRFRDGGEYSEVIMTIPLQQSYITDPKFHEVRPNLPPIDFVFEMISRESVSQYLRRLRVLSKIYKDGIFRCEHYTMEFVRNIMLPLLAEPDLELSTPPPAIPCLGGTGEQAEAMHSGSDYRPGFS